MAGPFDGLNGEFSSRVQALIAASGGRVRPGSGLRSVEEQARLRITNGCPDVYKSPASSCRVPTAIPGSSNHNHGLAMDLQFGSGGAAWAAQNAAQFGLHFPVRGENWHVEMIDDDGSRPHMQGARQRGAIGFDLAWQDEQRSPEDELSHRLDTVMQIVTGKDQDAGEAVVAEPEMPAELTLEGAPQAPPVEADQLRMDETTLPGGQRTQRPIPVQNMAPGGKGIDRWRPLVAQALQYVGEQPTEANIAMTLRRMQQESGGDPNVVNNWDSNAKRGTPSIGLMQVILPTFNAHAGELAGLGQRDPFANLVASMRYAKSRYGSLASAYNRPGGY